MTTSPYILADRVSELDVVTGTGAVTLGGSVVGYRNFSSVMSNGLTTWYTIVDTITGAWEVGLGTWNTGNTLSRTTVLASSNSGSLVSFAGNPCNVFMDAPAAGLGGNAAVGVPQTVVATGITANTDIGNLPANVVLTQLVLRETAGHAVSVGLGSGSGATDAVAAQSVPASGVLVIPASAFSKTWYTASAGLAMYLNSTSWGSASINACLTYMIGP